MEAPKRLLFHIGDNHIIIAPKHHPMHLHTVISTFFVFTLQTTCPLKFAYYEMVTSYQTSPLDILSSLLTHIWSLKSSSETVTLHYTSSSLALSSIFIHTTTTNTTYNGHQSAFMMPPKTFYLTKIYHKIPHKELQEYMRDHIKPSCATRYSTTLNGFLLPLANKHKKPTRRHYTTPLPKLTLQRSRYILQPHT